MIRKIAGQSQLLRSIKTFVHMTRSIGAGHAVASARFAMGCPFPAGTDRKHLDATLQWLCAAQDATNEGGVSAVYSLRSGWDVPYPETSGYILATLLAASDYLGIAAFEARARRIGEWEIGVQAPNGGVYSRPGSPDTRVFNTGQVMLGWCTLYERTGEARFLEAARRAGDYLLGIQEPDGTWHRDTYCGARTYHARTDWALLRLWKLTGESRYADSARCNLRWVMQQQQDNGWFANCGFNSDDPITHVIDYTLIGLIESALLDNSAFDRSPTELVARSAEAICTIVAQPGIGGIPGMIPASFDRTWGSKDVSSCLTGNAQLAYTLFRLDALERNRRYEAAADSLVHALKGAQATGNLPACVRGGLPGSYPMHTGYLADSFPNWGAKFYADALMASLHRRQGLAIGA